MTPKLSARGVLIGKPTLSSRVQMSSNNNETAREEKPASDNKSIDHFA
jgi:hypothetical protein